MFPANRLARKGSRRKAGRLDFNAEFFLQLPDERGLRCLAFLDFAARKFPEAGHAAMGRPLLKKNPSVSVDESGRDNDHCRIFFQRNDFP